MHHSNHRLLLSSRGDVRQKPLPVLLFSGGRDSSIAAARMADQGEALHLITVIATHLQGIDLVERRIEELENILPAGSEWWIIQQPNLSEKFGDDFTRTCLPCQHDYLLTGARFARVAQSNRVALGYTHYQSDWPEQTPEAVSILRKLAPEFGFEFDFPVYNLNSKSQAIEELSSRDLSEHALEQKCTRQIHNLRLGRETLREHLRNWERWLRVNFEALESLEIEILKQRRLGL